MHGKKHNHQPEDFMWRGAEWKARMRGASSVNGAPRAEGMSGDEMIARFRAAGVQIIDKRKRITDGGS